MTDRVLPLGDPRLRDIAAPVDLRDPALGDERRRLHAALAAFRAAHGFGRAIAAPQLGIGKRFIAVDLGAGAFTLHNPTIVWRSADTFTLWDDCMCFPDLLVRVRRTASISVSYLDDHGDPHTLEELDRRTAELLQHEIDHLDGVLALDRAEGRDAIVSRTAFAMHAELLRAQVDLPPPFLAP
jgi:peptide deformylase